MDKGSASKRKGHCHFCKLALHSLSGSVLSLMLQLVIFVEFVSSCKKFNAEYCTNINIIFVGNYVMPSLILLNTK